MAKVRANSVSFNIFRIIYSQKLLIEIAPILFSDRPGDSELRVVFRAFISDLAEQSPAATAILLIIWEVYMDIVILSANRFFNKWLSEGLPVHDEGLAILRHYDFLVLRAAASSPIFRAL